MNTRVFTREELDDMRLPNCWAPEHGKYMQRREGEATSIFTEVVEAGDWEITTRMIFLAPDDGKHYEIYYKQGATELQEDTDPWADEDQVEATEVEKRPVVRAEWKPVQRGMMQLGNAVVDIDCVRPFPPAQGIADEAAHGCWEPNFQWLREKAEELGILHAVVYVPDTGLPGVLNAYLDRAETAAKQDKEGQR
ncbi:hypothetical protein ACFW2V_14070 [Streptomyces sp. NPDC058947]|uniref:hypothetical protein n=1 Tax=Streptomyces sp. NPDC058947 TaxID=3346675 RepID=UPI0036964759